MKVFVRADSSSVIGYGHLMRCLTLARQLREECHEVWFVCRQLPGAALNLVEQAGFPVHIFDNCVDGWEADARAAAVALEDRTAEWLVVDHYGLDARWERAMRKHSSKIMVIDDLADRPHDADLLLDQNLYPKKEGRYQGLVPPGCMLLLGPSFALLREEFVAARKSLRTRDGRVQRILVSYGGSDPTGETVKATQALAQLGRHNLRIDIVLNPKHPDYREVEILVASLPNASLHPGTSTMANLMAAADLAIGAAGTSTWERCSLGLPAIVTAVAENQTGIAQAAEENGVGLNLGESSLVTPGVIVKALEKIVDSAADLKQMSMRSLALMGDVQQGGVRAVVAAMLQESDRAA